MMGGHFVYVGELQCGLGHRSCLCVCVFVPLNVFEQAACVLQIQYLFLSKLFRHKSEPSACRTWKSRTNSCGRPWTTTTTNSPRSRIKVSGQLVSVYVLFLYLNRLWTSHGIPTYHTIYIILVLRYWLARTHTHTYAQYISLCRTSWLQRLVDEIEESV